MSQQTWDDDRTRGRQNDQDLESLLIDRMIDWNISLERRLDTRQPVFENNPFRWQMEGAPLETTQPYPVASGIYKKIWLQSRQRSTSTMSSDSTFVWGKTAGECFTTPRANTRSSPYQRPAMSQQKNERSESGNVVPKINQVNVGASISRGITNCGNISYVNFDTINKLNTNTNTLPKSKRDQVRMMTFNMGKKEVLKSNDDVQ